MPQFDKLRIYFNGALVPPAEARVSVFDSALMFGDMAFEMTRSFQRRPFLLDRHLDRLYASLKLIEIDCGLTQEQMEQVTLQTIEYNAPFIEEDLDFWIMHDVSRGPLDLYHQIFPEGLRPTVVISVWPVIGHITRVAEAYETGLHVVIPSQRAIPSRYLDPKAKTRSRLHYEMANLQAERIEAGAWPVLLDEHGYLAEGPGFTTAPAP